MERKVIAGSFEDEESILAAVRAAREAGYSIQDVYTPYPVHGMDEAMGLRRSNLPRLCFLFGALGLAFAMAFQWWVSVFDWPMNIGGKSFHASPALIPVAFEFTVLCAGLGTVAALLRKRGLFPGRRPAFSGLGASDDRFLLALREPGSGRGEPLRRFLKGRGAAEIEEAGLG